MISIEVPKEITFDLPEGNYRTIITGVKPITKQTRKGAQNWVRIHFDVTVPGMDHLDCRAARNFQLTFKQGSELRNFLTDLLGADFFAKYSSKNVDLEAVLKGKLGLSTLVHFQGADFDKPMVIVDHIQPLPPESNQTGGKD